MQGALPKPYLQLGGEPILRLSLRSLKHYSPIQAVIRLADRARYQEAIMGFEGCMRAPAIGGETRALSVLSGLRALNDISPDIVLIHDAARPFIPPGLVEKLVAAIEEGYLGAAPALPISDSLKRCAAGDIISCPNEQLIRTQTPQAFDYQALMKAFQHATLSERDELAILEHPQCGNVQRKIKLVSGDHRNIKLTYPEDFDAVRSLRPSPPMRSAIGIDAHRFQEGNHIMLGGVHIAHDRGLAAHSDGDVVLHALCDAIFGLVADRDLGAHFPNSPKWKGAASDRLLARALEKLADSGLKITHVDITIICAAPKIAPHRDHIRQRLAELLALDMAQISVKATTSDGMGLTGKGEGIAAATIVSALKEIK